MIYMPNGTKGNHDRSLVQIKNQAGHCARLRLCPRLGAYRVIRALAEAGIEPDIVCGCSIGAMAGAAYVYGELDKLESWVAALRRKDAPRSSAYYRQFVRRWRPE